MVYQGHMVVVAAMVWLSPHRFPSFQKGGEDHKDQGESP